MSALKISQFCYLVFCLSENYFLYTCSLNSLYELKSSIQHLNILYSLKLNKSNFRTTGIILNRDFLNHIIQHSP